MTRRALALAALAALAHGPIAAPSETGATAVRVEFTSTPAPQTAAERATAYTRSSAVVTWADGRKKTFPLRYQVLFRSGDPVGAGRAGLILDRDGEPVLESAPGRGGAVARGPFHANSPDGNSLIQVRDADRTRLYLVTQYEYHTEAPNQDPDKPPLPLPGRLPMAINLTTLHQHPESGGLQATALANIDLRAIRGAWTLCASSLSPWNTHLAGEEYEPDAASFERRPIEAMNLYLKTPGQTGRAGGARAYDYGHIVEVTVRPDGAASAVRHYALGRMSAELAEVLPDERTVYISDDGRDAALFMFVADRPRDLSAGTLYAARWEQVAAGRGGKADLRWVRLGHASDAEIRALVDRGIAFSDIFETIDAASYRDKPELTRAFRPVYVFAGPGAGFKGRQEFLKLKPGREQAAAFLESRRYAAYLGATTEFAALEGIAHNRRDHRLYLALSAVAGGMLDGQNGARPQDHIRIAGDPRDLACGGVYESPLRGGQTDTGGAPIRSEWVAVGLRPLVSGARKPAGQKTGPYDACDTERPANPDNLKYSEALRTLFIGEDSARHLNNFLWAYPVDTGKFTRLLSAPAGGEITGLQAVPDLDGHGYIFANIQHPGAARELEKYPDEVRVGLRARIDPRGAVGYLGGWPGIGGASGD